MKDPAFLFYYQDFLVGTYFMSNDCVGAYIRCLCHQAHNWTISEKDMIKICQSHEIHTEIKSKFLIDDNGEYYNERLREEIAKRKKYSQSRSENRKSTGRKYQSDNEIELKSSKKEREKDMNNICRSHDQHMEDENENEILSYENKVEVNNKRKEKEGTGRKGKEKEETLIPQLSETVLLSPCCILSLDACKIELLRDQHWIEQITMSKGYSSITETQVMLTQFFNKLKDDGVLQKNTSEAKKHFNNWLNYQKKQENDKSKSATPRQDKAVSGFLTRLEERNNAFLARQQQESN